MSYSRKRKRNSSQKARESVLSVEACQAIDIQQVRCAKCESIFMFLIDFGRILNCPNLSKPARTDNQACAKNNQEFCVARGYVSGIEPSVAVMMTSICISPNVRYSILTHLYFYAFFVMVFHWFICEIYVMILYNFHRLHSY